MSETNQPAQVQEKAPKPAGLLPKNVRSWLLIILAMLMVIIMWLTGGQKPQVSRKAIPTAALAPAPLEVNETKIAELQTRIQELQRQQLVAQNALAQQAHVLGAAAQDPQQSQQQNGPGASAEQRPEDQIRAERKRRAYLSLFASNVALTYRKPPVVEPPVASQPVSAVIYVIVTILLAAAQAVAFVVIAYGFIATAVCVLVGPVFVPFFIVPKMEWLFWGWFRCFLQYAFYQVIAAAVVFVIGNLMLGVLRLPPAGTLSPVQLITWFPVLFITFLASIYALLKVPALTNHIFSGTAGASSAGIVERVFE